jgi:hypothetical protein
MCHCALGQLRPICRNQNMLVHAPPLDCASLGKPLPREIQVVAAVDIFPSTSARHLTQIAPGLLPDAGRHFLSKNSSTCCHRSISRASVANCASYAMWREASEQLQAEGLTAETAAMPNALTKTVREGRRRHGPLRGRVRPDAGRTNADCKTASPTGEKQIRRPVGWTTRAARAIDMSKRLTS